MLEMNSLSWKLPEDEQRRNIRNLQIESDDDIRKLILPYRRQECWENCALALASLDDATILRFLPELLEWFKDLNWPGVNIVHSRILKLPKEEVHSVLANVLLKASIEKDEEWIENLHTAFDE